MSPQPQPQPEITPEQIALFRRCHFVHQVFRPRDALQGKEPIEDPVEWLKSLPAEGEDFDPQKFEVIEGGWDHEHCDVCWVSIEDGDPYWANERPGDVDLCETCYERVRAMLRDQGCR